MLTLHHDYETLTLMHHARARMQQRGITREMIYLALDFGDPIVSYGWLRIEVTDRSLRRARRLDLADRLRGLSVVLGMTAPSSRSSATTDSGAPVPTEGRGGEGLATRERADPSSGGDRER